MTEKAYAGEVLALDAGGGKKGLFVCSHCHTEMIIQGGKFCSFCGGRVVWPDPTPTDPEFPDAA